jgi:hypothetical protein
MYDISQVTTALTSLVGFKDETGYTLPASLTSPTSSLTVNTFEPLLSLQTLDNAKPSNYTSLGDFLTDIRESAIKKAVNDVVNAKLTKQVQKSVIKETPLINGTANRNNVQTKQGRFVGWVFRLPESISLVHRIKKFMVQFNQNVTDLPIYVYHSSQVDPIKIVNITTTNSPSVSTIELVGDDIIDLKFGTNETDQGGFYYIGYYEDDLPEGTSALFKRTNVGARPCSSCDSWAIKYYNNWNGLIDVQASYVSPNNLSGTDFVSDVTKIEQATDTNFGLNFYFSFLCDLTEYIILHKEMFSTLIQTRLALDLMRYIESSPTRNNRVADSVAKEAFVRINGSVSENNFIKVRGLIHDYDTQVKASNFDFSRLDRYCLPNTRHGIRWN